MSNGTTAWTRAGSSPEAVRARKWFPATYELTVLVLSLQHVMLDIKAWAESHMDEVLANRETYDARVA